MVYGNIAKHQAALAKHQFLSKCVVNCRSCILNHLFNVVYIYTSLFRDSSSLLSCRCASFQIHRSCIFIFNARLKARICLIYFYHPRKNETLIALVRLPGLITLYVGRDVPPLGSITVQLFDGMVDPLQLWS